MHDTILFNKISEAVRQICTANNIRKVNKLAVIVNHKSHVDEHNLFEYLQDAQRDLIGLWTEIKVEHEDIQDQTAILHSIQGEKGEA